MHFLNLFVIILQIKKREMSLHTQNYWDSLCAKYYSNIWLILKLYYLYIIIIQLGIYKYMLTVVNIDMYFIIELNNILNVCYIIYKNNFE